MAWVRLETGFFRHRKVVQAGRDARDLALASWCWAADSLTDGFIPVEALKGIAAEAKVGNPKRLAERLVEVGLWESVEGGYLVHDYLDFNPTKTKVLATRAARAEVGSIGGKRSGDTRRSKTEANDEANCLPVASRKTKHVTLTERNGSSPSELLPEKTDRGGSTSNAAQRAREHAGAIVAVNGGSPQQALKAVAQIAFGFTGQTRREKEREADAVTELVKHGVTPDELQDLISEYRRRGWPNPSLSAVSGRLGQLRAPAEPGRGKSESKLHDNLGGLLAARERALEEARL